MEEVCVEWMMNGMLNNILLANITPKKIMWNFSDKKET